MRPKALSTLCAPLTLTCLLLLRFQPFLRSCLLATSDAAAITQLPPSFMALHVAFNLAHVRSNVGHNPTRAAIINRWNGSFTERGMPSCIHHALLPAFVRSLACQVSLWDGCGCGSARPPREAFLLRPV